MPKKMKAAKKLVSELKNKEELNRRLQLLQKEINFINETIKDDECDEYDKNKQEFCNFLFKNKVIKNYLYENGDGIIYIFFYYNFQEIESNFNNYSYLMFDTDDSIINLFKNLKEVKKYLLDRYNDFNLYHTNGTIVDNCVLFSLEEKTPKQIKFKSTINIDIKTKEGAK